MKKRLTAVILVWVVVSAFAAAAYASVTLVNKTGERVLLTVKSGKSTKHISVKPGMKITVGGREATAVTVMSTKKKVLCKGVYKHGEVLYIKKAKGKYMMAKAAPKPKVSPKKSSPKKTVKK